MFPQKYVFKMYYRLFNFFAACAQIKANITKTFVANIIKLEYKTRDNIKHFYIVNVTTCPEIYIYIFADRW